MTSFRIALLFAVSGALGACNHSPAAHNEPITGNHPAPVDTTTAVPVDTAAPAVHGPVPFVNPTKIGRTLGPRSPSPPASRTH